MRNSDARKVIKLASEMSKQFERKTRDNGETFVTLKDDAPEWMTDVCRDAHDRMLPDDIRYAFIEEAVDTLSNLCDETSTENDLLEAADTLEADCYTSDLTTWLASRNSRYSYVDEYVENNGYNDIISALQGGQLTEKQETFHLVLQALENVVDELDEAV